MISPDAAGWISAEGALKLALGSPAVIDPKADPPYDVTIPLFAAPPAPVGVTEEMVERAARAMEPMAFREAHNDDEWGDLAIEGRAQALGRARAALIAALTVEKDNG
jgi:hypothetical protein